MERITEQALDHMYLCAHGDLRVAGLPGASFTTGPQNVIDLVAEVRRLRAILDRIHDDCPMEDQEFEREVLEIRQERRGAEIVRRGRERGE